MTLQPVHKFFKEKIYLLITFSFIFLICVLPHTTLANVTLATSPGSLTTKLSEDSSGNLYVNGAPVTYVTGSSGIQYYQDPSSGQYYGYNPSASNASGAGTIIPLQQDPGGAGILDYTDPTSQTSYILNPSNGLVMTSNNGNPQNNALGQLEQSQGVDANGTPVSNNPTANVPQDITQTGNAPTNSSPQLDANGYCLNGDIDPPYCVTAYDPNASSPPSDSTGGSIAGPGANSQVTATGNTSAGQGQAATAAVGNAGSCSVGQILANAITSTISSALGTAKTQSNNQTNQTTVGIHNPNTDIPTNGSVAAHTGSFTPTGTLTGVSWDSIAYCVGNALIQYIGNSTIAWINGGFNGNPAFVNNPQQFFQDVADQQASTFVNQLGRGLSGIAPPLVNSVTNNLVGNYNSNFFGSQPTQWSAAQTSNYNSFISGNPNAFNLNSFYSVSQNPNLNYVGANYQTQLALQQKLAQQQNLQQQQLQWNQGYNSVKTCKTNADGTQTCNTTVPGTNINQTAQANMNLAGLRAAASQKFDQVITVLVNELIKTALNKVFTQSGH